MGMCDDIISREGLIEIKNKVSEPFYCFEFIDYDKPVSCLLLAETYTLACALKSFQDKFIKQFSISDKKFDKYLDVFSDVYFNRNTVTVYNVSGIEIWEGYVNNTPMLAILFNTEAEHSSALISTYYISKYMNEFLLSGDGDVYLRKKDVIEKLYCHLIRELKSAVVSPDRLATVNIETRYLN